MAVKKASDFFFRLGGTAWLLTVGLSALALVLRWLAGLTFGGDAWRSLWLIGAGGGLACFIAGWIFLIWDA